MKMFNWIAVGCVYLLGALQLNAATTPGSAKLGDADAEWSEKGLTVRSGQLERRWSFANGLLVSQSIRDRVTGREWVLEPASHPAPAPEFPLLTPCVALTVDAAVVREVVGADEALCVSVHATYDDAKLTTLVKVFPNSPAITTQLLIDARGFQSNSPTPSSAGTAASAILVQGSGTKLGIPPPEDSSLDLNDAFTINQVNRTLSWVDFMDDTDRHDNLVHISTDSLTIPSTLNVPSGESYRSNLFYIEDQLSGDGLVILKEAPLPHARPIPARWDLRRTNGVLAFHGLGAGSEQKREGYPLAVIAYRGGSGGRIEALQNYQRHFRRFDPMRDVRVWPCIWGDRNRDGKVSEPFFLAELERLHHLDMDFVYFIDGWQNGPSSNSVVAGGRWDNQWAVPGYWEINRTRFPRGLGTITKKADEFGIKRGMWFNPDKTNDYANWEKDADTILARYRETGATWFKFDGVVFSTKLGERNLISAMRRIVEVSEGKVSIEIDITAGVRTGYWSAMPYGVLFLENRYTDLHRYWPHSTLRNLWDLAHFVDPRRLRVEFLNPERNAALYKDDPLAPQHYEIDYLFASVMFANPLAWFEVTGLSEKAASKLGAVIAAEKPYWEAIAKGTIYPIGDRPSGMSWTGFQSDSGAGENGFVVALREFNEVDHHDLTLFRLVPGRYQFEALAGEGKSFTLEVGKSGKVNFQLPSPRSYAFYRYSRLKD